MMWRTSLQTQYLAAADSDDDSRVSFPEFVNFLLTRHEAIDLVFSMLDTDKSGTLNLSEMKAALQKV
jgi:Ca2+-binding EF-hand superfamily protein